MTRTVSPQSAVPFLARATIRIWWTIAMLLIATTALACPICAYACLSALITSQWYAAGGLAGLSLASAMAAFALCRYRGDLVGDLSSI